MSKVYFTDFRASSQCNLLSKIQWLCKEAGIENISFENKFTAIKIHFGEPGNLAYLRPNYAKAIVDLTKSLGARPFLTDCNTLYVGRRKNALDHLEAAYENGFSPFSTGCHVLIADGLKGTDEVEVAINGKHVQKAKIGQAIMDADIFISLNHFKGHESTGFGGAIKNIGMGCGSRAGKMEQHYGGKPKVKEQKCVSCGQCYKNCAHGAITFVDKKANISVDKCVGCGRCIGACNYDAIKPIDSESNLILNEKMAEYAFAVLKDRPHFHISLIMDVSPYCDCHSENDLPIVPNIGMLASFDPISLDMACADLVNQAPIMPGSMLDHAEHCHEDHFTDLHPETDWKSCMIHGEKMGIGQMEYELVRI